MVRREKNFTCFHLPQANGLAEGSRPLTINKRLYKKINKNNGKVGSAYKCKGKEKLVDRFPDGRPQRIGKMSIVSKEDSRPRPTSFDYLTYNSLFPGIFSLLSLLPSFGTFITSYNSTLFSALDLRP